MLRVGFTALAAAVLLVSNVSFADGARPTQGWWGDNPNVDIPPSPEEQAVIDWKLSRAAAHEVDAADDPVPGDVTPLCVIEGDDPGFTQDCYVPSGTLATEPRDQDKNIYCGPAVVQVASNWSWMKASGANKHTQQVISNNWTKTDANGGTDAYKLRDGMNGATASSPRRPPAPFAYVVQPLVDTDGDGTAGDQMHNYIETDINTDHMPVAIPLKPHQPGAQVWLSSWPNAHASVGHWILIYGWRRHWDNSRTPLLRYDDSSKDEGGSTGAFSDPSKDIYDLVRVHTNRIVW